MSEQKKMVLGFNCRGTEEVFEQKIRRAIENRSTVGFRYVEIGIANGTTLKAVAELLRESAPFQHQCVGVDLFGGHFFNEREFIKSTPAFNTILEFLGRGNQEPFIGDKWGYDIRVMLLKGDSKRVMVGPNTINFALIDGCHGAPCVEKDFLAIEPGVADGGIVAFHDAGEADQGIHFQKHCGMPISVRKALDNLELLSVYPARDSANTMFTERAGWKFVGHVDGDKSPGSLEQNGHGFVFYQKIKVDVAPAVPNPANTNPPTI